MNNFNIPYKTSDKRFRKAITGTALSVAILFSGSALLAPQSTYAASAGNAASASVAATSTSSSLADKIIATGKQYLGVEYEFGAKSGQTNTFDCSSFTQYVFKQNGIELPRSSKQQAKMGTYVAKSDLQPGDLIFSDTNSDGVINHVSIYIGNGQVLQTYRVGIGVTISDFEGSTWDRTYVTARRVIADDSATNDTANEATDDATATNDTANGATDDTTDDASNAATDDAAQAPTDELSNAAKDNAAGGATNQERGAWTDNGSRSGANRGANTGTADRDASWQSSLQQQLGQFFSNNRMN
ncbi:C40 family peptidase [Cohnella fermenti]|uniref:NlpC/P60 family protein n=1 Tax=Cohnella fermenti TaxID=2565925 RepID=A0A4S4BND6_9BACL|nr:NlpC/P60 family protein [Cohnella fermenti]